MEELTPITRREVFLAKAAGQDVETPTPVTREEVFLDAIANGGGGGLPAVTAADNGKALTVDDGAWQTDWPNKDPFALDGQVIPISYDGTSFTTTVTPQDIANGYTINDTDFPSFRRASQTKAYINGDFPVYLIPVTGDSDGVSFQSMIFSLDSIGMVGKVGCLILQPNGYFDPYTITLSTCDKGGKYIVTLTPTALDYSGTMDKTVAEIAAAYNAGQEIWFRIMMSSNAYVETPLTYCLNDGIDYPGFGTQAIEFNNGVLIVARIPSTNDGTTQTYSTTVYSLTPAS